MKIAILTQPLNNNYGGLLQAYALKEVLQEMGHEVVIINRHYKPSSLLRKCVGYTKRRLMRQSNPPNYFIRKEYRKEVSKNTTEFIKKYIPNMSEKIISNRGMNKLNNMNFDVLLVGSDQCWRPRYSPNISNFFFDFARKKNNIKRISYAASFGVSDWEFTEKETATAKDLLQKFDIISVREDSAINLIKNHLGRDDAVHVLDPTMLLSTEHYNQIIEKESTPDSPGSLYIYILDQTRDKMSIVRQVEKQLDIKKFEVYPKKRLEMEKVTKDNINNFIFPSPDTWIKGFSDAEFVIADSFHGIVFSILFNIPFLAIGNETRGLSRFTSLLKMFDLEDRLVTNFSNFTVDSFLSKKIDWTYVNGILQTEKTKSLELLKQIQ